MEINYIKLLLCCCCISWEFQFESQYGRMTELQDSSFPFIWSFFWELLLRYLPISTLCDLSPLSLRVSEELCKLVILDASEVSILIASLVGWVLYFVPDKQYCPLIYLFCHSRPPSNLELTLIVVVLDVVDTGIHNTGISW